MPQACWLSHLGIGLSTGRPIRFPRRIGSLASHAIVEVAAGYEHSLFLSDRGAVWSCGVGDHGRLGHGSLEGCDTPRRIESLESVVVVQVVAGGFQSLALDEAGRAWSWGWGESGSVGHGHREHTLRPSRIEALAKTRLVHASAGSSHSLFVDMDGALYACGDHRYGKLGLGEISDDVLSPARVTIDDGVLIRQASAWHAHSLAVSTCGALYSFGCGSDGRLGHGNQENYTRPTRVKALARHNVRAAAAGELHSIVHTSDGKVLSFGFGWHGQTGQADLVPSAAGALPPPLMTPRRVTSLPRQAAVAEVAVGDHHTLVRLEGDELFAFGANTEGQLGVGTPDDDKHEQPPDMVRDPKRVVLWADAVVPSPAASRESGHEPSSQEHQGLYWA